MDFGCSMQSSHKSDFLKHGICKRYYHSQRQTEKYPEALQHHKGHCAQQMWVDTIGSEKSLSIHHILPWVKFWGCF